MRRPVQENVYFGLDIILDGSILKLPQSTHDKLAYLRISDEHLSF